MFVLDAPSDEDLDLGTTSLDDLPFCRNSESEYSPSQSIVAAAWDVVEKPSSMFNRPFDFDSGPESYAMCAAAQVSFRIGARFEKKHMQVLACNRVPEYFRSFYSRSINYGVPEEWRSGATENRQQIFLLR